MSKIISDEGKIKKLIEYYKDNGLVIVGLNDSQGVNVSSTFFRKGLLEYIASALTSDELTPEVINAFSLTMNKTEHIEYLLRNNVSLEEIKLSQVYGAVSALEKVMTDINLPKFLGGIGNVYKLTHTPKSGDAKINITTSLKEAKEPVMIYSSGVNDLMREVGANPFGIKSDYKNKDKKPNYYYTLEKTSDPRTLTKVIDSIKRNYDLILGINSKTDVYTLGAYIPKSLQSDEMNIFRDLVIAYNEKLLDLCREYGITFVHTEEVGKKYNKSSNNFHITTAGHNNLANYILGCMYHNKFESKGTPRKVNIEPLDIKGNGVVGVIESLADDYNQTIERAENLCGYAQDREYDIAEEHAREGKIFEKVLKQTYEKSE